MNSLEAKQESVNQQGANVRALKAQGAPQEEIAAAIEELKRLKVDLETELTALKEAGNAEAKAKEEFRSKLSQLLEGRLFYIPSFKIYGGVAGLYDYGPPGCAVKANVQQFWRQHFVFEESMLEVECPAVTPESVLRASG
jgi:glycyl-tRNA synthetase